MAQVGNLIVTGSSRFLNKINGACTDGTSGTTKYMRQDGTWQVPPNDNTDTKVTQTETTTNANYRLLFSESSDDTTKTESARKSHYAMFNPSKHSLTIGYRGTNTTEGTNSIALGQDLTASGDYSFCTGVNNKATSLYSYAEGANTTSSGNGSHTEGVNTEALGTGTHAEGYETSVSSSSTGGHAEGLNSTANGNGAHAEGYYTTSSSQASHAEGSNTTASGYVSHAEGYSSQATGNYSHAEGNSTIASGQYGCHAEGAETTASGNRSHAEGNNTTARGETSHAEGTGTTASHKSQHVFGEYNSPDDSSAAYNSRGNYVEIVGNGTGSSAKSNARTLNWNGNEWIAGTLTQGSSIEIKKNVADMTQEDGDKILNLRPVVFDYKSSEKDIQAERGFIAEEVKEIIPNLVTDKIVNDEGETVAPASLNYIAMIPYLVKVCQRQQEEIDRLKSLIAEK